MVIYSYTKKKGVIDIKKLQNSIKKFFQTTDSVLLILCILTSLFSVVCLYSLVNSSVAETLKISKRIYLVQSIASILGIIAAIIISYFDYHFLARLWKLFVPVSVGLVLLTFVIGAQVDENIDDKAWLLLPFGLSFQPSELMKICFIMSFAYHLSKVKDNLNSPLNIILLGLHGAFPVLLVHFQGDDGTAIIFLAIFLVMLFAAGLDWKYIVAGLAVAAITIPIFWQYVLSEDQKNRFLSVYLSEYSNTQSTGYQQFRSVVSIGTGKLLGRGLFSDSYLYVPELQNDFIFSFIGQATGFVGCMSALFLLGGICFKTLSNARSSLDALGSYICYGFFAMIFAQCFINIGMCMSVVPVIGITLPLLSAGGTSVAITYLGVGLVLSVYSHRKNNLFYQ